MKSSIFRQNNPIDRSFVPNLRRLNVCWNNYNRQLEFNGHLETPNQLFSRDVFFRLTHFSLDAECLNNEVVQDILSMLSAQCSYSLDVRRFEVTAPIIMLPSITNNLVLNTLRQLKGWKPMEVVVERYDLAPYIRAYTLPRKTRQLNVTRYLGSLTVLAHDRWPDVVCRPNQSFSRVSRIVFNTYGHFLLVDNLISYLPSILPWYQITYLTINDTLKLAELRSILCHALRIRTLELVKSINKIEDLNDNIRLLLVDLLEDTLTCDVLTSNGLQKLIFTLMSRMSNMIHMADMIVKRFPGLQIVEVCCCDCEAPKVLDALINGLLNLNFLVATCGALTGKSNELQLRALQTGDTRCFRTKIQDSLECDVI